MPTDQLHHSGVLVADIDRAADFYLDVFDGHWLFKPAVNRGEAAQKVFGGTADVAFAFCYIGFRTGAIELVQFLEGAPAYASEKREAPLPHFALVVDDVVDTTARVEAAGGSRIWDEPVSWGGATVMYVADPDGNPIELFDTTLQRIVDLTIELFPESRP
jgi:catechol 2,3-dioxygenase-like lactoylglutathione lyase family enzyme